jgi:hypothetical protein
MNGEQYALLQEVLEAAYNQAVYGKGKARHATDEPFEEQPICQIARWVGLGFPAGQAIKKVREATRTHSIDDLLGAINYIAAMVIVMREHDTAS